MPTFSTYDGTELAYHPVGEGKPLVCLPGGPMRASEYLGDLGGLAAHRQLIRLDLRGTGDSAAPAAAAAPLGYRCDRQVDDVEALRAHLGLARLDLLAHSAAGELALLYAARHPRRLASLTLVTPSATAAGIEATTEDRREAMALRAGEPWYAAATAAFEEVLAGRATDEVWATLKRFNHARWDAAAQAMVAASPRQINQEAAAAFFGAGAFDPAATRAALATLAAPVLVVAGALDGGPRPAKARALAGLFGHGRLAVLEGAGHFPWLDEPGAFVRTVAGFPDSATRGGDAEAGTAAGGARPA
ncbi:alpha/beta fold hydrolase [Streptomyces sp. NPDC059255]|uniref:alpha/beta fold hydrolase n=1 Tax=Streptomyces sp. NPDC059255 TaxID=3346793 RepID=UPI0036C5B6D5